MSIKVITRSKSHPTLGRLFTMTAEFIDTLVDSLANPGEPKHCTRYYISCMHLFNIEPSVYAEFRCVRPDIFAAILRFLTIQRPDTDIPSLEKRLSTCRCAETDKEYPLKSTHILDAPPTGKAFPYLMERAASFMTLSFLQTVHGVDATEMLTLDKTRKEAKKADKRGERFPWPKQPRDVYVNPPEMMLLTLWKLYHTYEETTVVIFIQLLMLAAGTTFTSVIYTIPDFPLQFPYHFERALAQNTESSLLAFSMMLHILLYATNRVFESDVHLIQYVADICGEDGIGSVKGFVHIRRASRSEALYRPHKTRPRCSYFLGAVTSSSRFLAGTQKFKPTCVAIIR